jgi:hypothetical protein
MWIERTSTLEKFASDVYSIINKKMMEEEYFESIQEEIEELNENNTNVDIESIEEKLKQTISKFVSIEGVSKSEEILLEDNSFLNKKPDFKLRFLINETISESNKFNIESLVKKFENVNFVVFREGEIEIDVTP